MALVSSSYSVEYATSHLLPDRLEATNVYAYAYISCTLLPLTDPTLQPILEPQPSHPMLRE